MNSLRVFAVDKEELNWTFRGRGDEQKKRETEKEREIEKRLGTLDEFFVSFDLTFRNTIQLHSWEASKDRERKEVK